MKLRELGEFSLIERIRERTKNGSGVIRGIGDDAAVLELPQGHRLLSSTDMLIEGIHFRHEWTSPENLGHKAVAVNLSDIAAMGGTPRFLYLGLACPGETDLEIITAFMEGVLAEAERHDVTLVGGDTCHSPGPWMISVTIEGSVPAGNDVGRNGARSGDLIMVTGTLGDSAMALHSLDTTGAADPALGARHHRPSARVEFGRQIGLLKLANAMIDISDGLAGDLEHILQASQVNGLIFEDRLPRSEAFQLHAGNDPVMQEMALFGGEDYELLFTVPPEKASKAIALGVELNLPVSKIGTIQKGSGVLSLQDRTGSKRPIVVRSYDHFCRP